MTYRTFAIRAGNMESGEATLRMAERLAQERDVLETQLDAEVLEPEQAIEQGGPGDG